MILVLYDLGSSSLRVCQSPSRCPKYIPDKTQTIVPAPSGYAGILEAVKAEMLRTTWWEMTASLLPGTNGKHRNPVEERPSCGPGPAPDLPLSGHLRLSALVTGCVWLWTAQSVSSALCLSPHFPSPGISLASYYPALAPFIFQLLVKNIIAKSSKTKA